MPARTLLIHGTASGAGKSTLTAALGRLFCREGRRVAPFKAQNLSLNAVVVAGALPGEPPGEIGWAQAVQARACGLTPTLDMNPVLLKPGASGCQIILRGRVTAAIEPAVVRQSLDRLRAAHDLVLIEGAGSPAEINLRGDLPNHQVADWTGGPVLLVGDIERGGVFASLYGTWSLHPQRERIRGFIINKLHAGSASLLPAIAELEARTGVPTLGIIPFSDPGLGEEDSLGLACQRGASWDLRVAVLKLPHISNTTDFEELSRQPGVALRYVWDPAALRDAQVIILPGTKSTAADLAALRAAGLADIVLQRACAGTPVLGICGGYQMLGTTIHDPIGVESLQASCAGLGLLPVETRFEVDKHTGLHLDSYCIHHGSTTAPEARSQNVFGTLRHGWLQGPSLTTLLQQWRESCALYPVDPPSGPDWEQRMNAWADLVRDNCSWPLIQNIL